MATQQNQAYVPGVCNINRAEIAYRRKAGYAGLLVSLLLAIVLVAVPLSRWFRVVVFLPLFVAAIGFLQAHNKFCVSYGANGRQNAEESSQTASQVSDAVALKKDKSKSRRMNLQAAVIALIATALLLSVPVR